MTERDRPAVRRLIEECNAFEHLDLPIDPEGDGFVYWNAGAIAGVAGLEPGRVVETTGAVHPDHRRRGIGRALLEAVVAACRDQGTETCYVVLDEASPSGKAFVETIGAWYHISEYRMLLDRDAFRPSERNGGLQLDQVGADALDLFSSLAATGFGDPPEQQRGWLSEDMHQPGRRFWVARLEGEPIGTVRVVGFGSGAPGSSVYTTTLAVLPEYRGRGFGRQILARITELLMGEDWERILIEVETENRNALGLYLSLGYRVVQTYGFYEVRL
jgi:ribosomal protein S18 acetylase RimI-like enzyme